MKTRDQIAIGDAVEARIMVHQRGQDGATEHWVPATVVFIDLMQIGIAFANGDRLAIPLHKTADWRVPPVTMLPTKWGTFTLAHMQEIKREHDKAVEAGQGDFQACGHEWATGFTKYLIEYAESEGMVL